jgi:Tol biopolymer transport system component
MDQLFFTREESRGVCIWSFNINNNYLANYTNGMNPFIAPDSTIIFSRMNSEGRGEIWKLDYQTGIEECILTDLERSFTTPSLSPDGRWILMTGSNALINGRKKYYNTDIFVCSLDGTDLRQLTYHAADDLSPVWSKDGEFIYFISQRGSIQATANVWRMSFGY